MKDIEKLGKGPKICIKALCETVGLDYVSLLFFLH